MNRALPALLLLASAALAAPDALDPAVAPPRPEKGERRRVTFVEHLVQRHERVMDDSPGAPRVLDSDERTEATWVQEVLEVGGDGRPNVVRVTFERWVRNGGPKGQDRSLEGRVAVVRRKTMDAALEPADVVTGAARRFLGRVADRLLRGSGVDEALRPPGPVQAGEAWDATASVGGLVLGAPHTEVAPDESKVEARLTKLEGGKATVELAGGVKLRNAPGTTDRFVEGGVCALKVAATFAPPDRPAQGAVELTGSLEGVTRGKLPDGKGYTTTLRLRHEVRTTEEPLR